MLNSWGFLRGIYKFIELKDLGTKLSFWRSHGATGSWLGIKQLGFGHRAQEETTASGASYSIHGCMKLFNLPTVNCGTPLQNTGEKENQIAWWGFFTSLFTHTSPRVQLHPELDILFCLWRKTQSLWCLNSTTALFVLSLTVPNPQTFVKLPLTQEGKPHTCLNIIYHII